MKTKEKQNFKLEEKIEHDDYMSITNFLYDQQKCFEQIKIESFFDGINEIQELKEMDMIQTAINKTIELGKKLESYSNSIDTIEKLLDNTF